MSSTSILGWPVELIELMLVYLHPIYVVKCRQVCRFLHQLIDSSIELRLRLELAEDGHLLQQRGRDPAVLLRKRVLSHRRCLEGFNPRTIFQTDTPGFGLCRYDTSDGIVASLMESEIQGQGSEIKRRIIYRELTCAKGGARWQKTWDFMDMEIIDLAFWSAQDIQILTEECDLGSCKRLHFRTMSTNLSHPRAAFAYLDLREPEVPVWDRSYTVLRGDMFVMNFKGDPRDADGRVFVMNWKTGEMILPHRDASSASFITETLLLLPLNNGTKGQDNGLTFEIFCTTAKAVLYRCLLPFDRPINDIWLFFNQNVDFPQNPYVSHPKDFVPDWDLNILGVVANVETVGGAVSAVMIVAVKPLLDICKRWELQSPGRPVEWDAWGPSTTRWLPNSLYNAGGMCLYGSRIVIREKRSEGDDSWNETVILDFNPRNLQRRSLYRSGEIVSVIREPSSFTYQLHQGPLTIISSLPFSKVVCGRYPYSTLDLDGMNLICREREDDLRVESLSGEE